MKSNPHIVATGTTSAFLSDERLLREFIVGNQKVEELHSAGENAALYLINDSYDALNERQLRIAVNKDEKLMAQFKEFCGRPIAEIPDPFETHSSLAEHFMQAQLTRLRELGIHPVVMDAYRAYKSGQYKHYTGETFANYARIQSTLQETFDSYSMKNLFRVQCSHCGCIDATHIRKVKGNSIYSECDRCGYEGVHSPDDIQGKLSWKLDCAARWNIYDIDFEAFSKSHTTDLGSYDVSRMISEKFYGGRVPEAIKYGEVKLSPELSYRLVEIMPPPLLKTLYTEHVDRDLDITKECVEQFCHRFEISPGMSFVDFVKTELPVLAIKSNDDQCDFPLHPLLRSEMDTKTLIGFGNRFSGFFYQKEYDVSLSGTNAIPTVGKEVAQVAMGILQYAINVRENDDMTSDERLDSIMQHLQKFQNVKGLFPYIRKTFAQQKGPGIATLLNSLPVDYLNIMRMAIGFYVGEIKPEQITFESKSTIVA